MLESLVRRWDARWTSEERDEAVAAADDQAAWALQELKTFAAEVEKLAQRFADASQWTITVREMRARVSPLPSREQRVAEDPIAAEQDRENDEWAKSIRRETDAPKENL